MSIDHEYLRLLQAMAEDLREYADAAAEAGGNIEATEALLAEYDERARRSHTRWFSATELGLDHTLLDEF